jgi:8-oxo-dGTP pyrophosphatase MutT (NUDIX family)
VTPVPGEGRGGSGDEGFRVVGSEPLCEAGFLSLARVRVASDTGEEFDRHVVHHPGAVVVVPVLPRPDGGHDALLVRQWRVATGQALLEIPAGKRDVEGEAPETTANRELEEEIGYVAGRLDKLSEFYNSPGFCDEYTHLFLATELEARTRAAVSHEEAAMTIERVALERVGELIATRELIDAKSIVGLLLAAQFLAAR